MLDRNSVGGTKYEFIISGCGDYCLSQIECMHWFIYPFHISVVNILCKYTLSCCVSEAVMCVC